MKIPPNEHSNLRNSLPETERKRLMPFKKEQQVLYIWQCKQKAIEAHNKHMKVLDRWMNNIIDGIQYDLPRP